MGSSAKQRWKITNWHKATLIATILSALWAPSIGTEVTSIEPTEGGSGGQVRITIFGSGFSLDNFNDGNTVSLVSSSADYSCSVNKDATLEDRILCYTPKGMVDGDYWVRVKVDGIDVIESNHCGSATSSSCRFRIKSANTPTITSVSPTAGPPGTIITMKGKMFTDLYGSTNSSATNGKTEKILRVYAVDQECTLKEPGNDNFYGFVLDSDSSDFGTMKCKLQGKFVANNNASFITEGKYGRSVRDKNILHQYSNGDLALFQTYAEVTSITPACGSNEGGTLITIAGNNFDNSTSSTPKNTVSVGGTVCDVQSVTETQIVCRTRAKPTQLDSSFPGNRGLLREIWNDTSKSSSSLNDISLFNGTEADYTELWTDQAYFEENGWGDYVSRLRGYFVVPFTGEYSFNVKSDKAAKLHLSNASTPENKTTVASYTRGSGHSSETRLRLTKNERYYVESLHAHSRDNSEAEVSARFYDTDVTNESTGMAEAEIQKIDVTSNILREIQNISLSGFSTGSKINEEQRITVLENSGSLSDVTFQLGMYEVYTVPLTTSSTAAEITAAIQQLPVFDQSVESIEANTNTPTSGALGTVISVEIISPRGDFPKFTVKVNSSSSGSPLSTSVEDVVNGQPTGEYFTLMMAGVPSPLIAYDASAATVREKLMSMFSVRCPSVFGNPSQKQLHYSFEDSNLPSGVWGQRYTEMEAFCGKASVLNPTFLYRDDDVGIDITTHISTLCFAVYGEISNRLYIKYTYQENDETKEDHHNFAATFEHSTSAWSYNCFDMRSALSDRHQNGDFFTVKRLLITRVSTEVFVDEVYIGKTRNGLSVENRRMAPSKPNNNLIEDAIVTKFTVSGNPKYEVKLIPLDCGYNFPKFQAISGQLRSGASLTVRREQAASPPMGGSYTITYMGTSKSGISATLDGPGLEGILENAIPDMGDIYVFRHGDCANFYYHVIFMSKAGDRPEMTVNSQLSGNDAAIAIHSIQNGSMRYLPIQGDMLQTIHSTPQVVVSVNNIRTKCSGTCDFEWRSDCTPTLIGVSPPTGVPASTEITLTGTMFDATHTNNEVTIGGVACTTKSSTTTQIVCDVGDGPGGAFSVEVNVKGKGKAVLSSGSVTFTYQFNVASISPTTSGLGGGLGMTLTGHGFSNTDVVKIGTNNCPVTSQTSTQTVCQVPASANAATLDIEVLQGGTTTVSTGTQFIYSTSSIALITNVTPQTSSVAGGATLTLTGSNFDTQGSLSVGGTAVTPSTFTATEVRATLPDLAAGTHRIELLGSNGFAVLQSSNQVPTIAYQMKIQNVYPTRGSVRGGTHVTLSGAGFPTDSSITEVKIGSYGCTILSLSNTQCVCRVDDTGSTHLVDNSGTHYAFGPGYEWNPKVLTIPQGDVIEFRWSYPSWITRMKPRVLEVVSPVDFTEVENGFNSGARSMSGVYRHRFNKPGTYYFWSDYIEDYQTTSFVGAVTVTERASTAELVSLKVLGRYEAEHDIGNPLSNPVSSGSCVGIVQPKSNCHVTEPSGSDSSKFYFKLWECSTPVLSAMDINNGTTLDTVNMEGTSFASTACLNEVKFGDMNCAVFDTPTDASLKCKIDPSNTPNIATMSEVEMRVNNLGLARVEISGRLKRTYTLNPVVSGISPEGVSNQGGAVLEISGTGFTGTTSDVKVTVDSSYDCPVTNVTYTKIKCTTPSGRNGNLDLKVEVRSPTNTFVEASFRVDNKITYDNSFTPAVSSVTPTSVAGPSTTLTVTGDKFGSSTDVTVKVGSEDCTVSSVNDTCIKCDVTNVAVGSNQLAINVPGKGLASGTVSVTSNATITSFSPSQGSIHGGTVLTIQGNGFDSSTAIVVDGSSCAVQSVTLSQVTCTTPPHAEASVNVAVTANSVSYPSQSYQYANSSSPTINSISPTAGSAGTRITINGENLSSNPSVTIGDVPCVVVSQSSTVITCDAGSKAVGTYSAIVNVPSKGKSNAVNFEYQLAVSSITPSSGSSSGGQTVTVDGSGFDGTTTVTVDGQSCTWISNTASQFVCVTPAYTGSGTSAVDVVATDNGVSQMLTNGYTYDDASVPTITSVSPARGGTGGGTLVTLAGSGFGSVSSDVDVSIDGTPCVVSSIGNTQIVCATGPNSRTVKSRVRLEKSNNGISAQNNADFEYVDLWSSIYTWNGSLPVAGDLVVIKKGQTVLLDIDTPIFKTILIQGGSLIFDEVDVELNAEIILVLDGGLFQIGTEENPHQHRATVTLHGHHRSKELPVYGTKVLAARHGTIDIHGQRITTTWTKLAATANAGSNTLTLMRAPDWKIGDQIVIATTGNMLSQKQNELHTIAAVSGATITLAGALQYEHLGVTAIADGTPIELRAEVGLLTHNILIRGNRDPQWDETIEECAAGFDPGEFATQTCFQGKFGEEMGSDQFGSQIILHADRNSSRTVTGRFENVEIFHAGQAFRLGRYPIHFHLNGDMSGSYVRGCAIHETFNRAINIHGTHNLLVEHNVIYNTMGGTLFLEDGIETGNIIQFNLVIFTRESSSLLNDDVTPASFWVTNPNNTIQHNAAAGGTHFGYWYRMHDFPDGPSHTKEVCPRKIPLGTFRNNTAHSYGWFGLWLFEVYQPRVDPCSSNSPPEPAKFYSFTAWNCEKGAEWVIGGAIQFIDFTLVNNKLAGAEAKKVVEGELFTDNSAGFINSLVVGYLLPLTQSNQGCTRGGIVLPYGYALIVKGVRFVNFNESYCAAFAFTRITGTCSIFCGGFQYETGNLTFNNAPNKGVYVWENEGIMYDSDGTLIGDDASTIAANAGKRVIPDTGILPPTCTPFPKFSNGIPAVACPSNVRFHRFSFNNISPTSLDYKQLIIKNQYGNDSYPWAKKRITHPKGWMAVLVSGEEHTITFENAEHMENISYTGNHYMYDTDDYVIIRQKLSRNPDRFMIDGSNNINSTQSIDPTTSNLGDWEYDEVERELRYIIVARSSSTGRKKRSIGPTATNFNFQFRAFKCLYPDCKSPPDPSTLPPATTRSNFTYWSQNSTWQNMPDGWGGNYGNGSYGLPQDGDDVQILKDTWVVADITLPSMNKLVLYGVLELENDFDHVLNCTYIVIFGGRLIVGWPDRPYVGNAVILLRGSHETSDYPITSGPNVRKKVIAAFGGLDIHGRVVQVPWTKLSQTASSGTSSITVETAVDWRAGDEIVIAPTGYSIWHTEVRKINSISADNMTLTLNESLQHTHIAHTVSANGMTIEMKAEVGLLTRNVRIEGEEYSRIYSQSFGARVLVGRAKEGGTFYTGYARLSNVEFLRSGQEGYIEPYDPGFSVAFLDTGTVSSNRPSYVRSCAFHLGFSPALGSFGGNGIPFENNVIHHTVYASIMTNAADIQIRGNLITQQIFEGTYQDRYESMNVHFNGAIDAMDATNLVMEDNHCAGAERVCYHVMPEDCSASTGRFSNNLAHTTLVGVGVFPLTDTIPGNCVKFSNFTIYKAHDYGVYANLGPSTVIDYVKVADSRVGVFPMIIGPAAVSHSFADKTVTVQNSLFVGMTSSFSCTTDVTDSNDDNIKLSSQARSPFGSSFVGVTIASFTSGSNNAPEKPLAGIMSYQAIWGRHIIQDVTFAEFNRKCNGVNNYAISPNKKNDDGIHPLQTRRLTFVNVDETNKLHIARPNLGKINSADCVDMDCDGLKKVLIRGEDSTLLGSPGAVIPQSEYEWDGNPRRGLGDYRIPKEMLTTTAGVRIDINSFAPNKGIIRSNQCSYVSDWQAYKCLNMNYRMLIVESMDSDTETRRLSPIAIKGDNYIDLINGPQDHGWCSGYTCRKRVSTFPLLVETGKEYLMHYTSTSPQNSRFFLLNSDSSEAIVLGIWYSQPSRLDVYHNGEFIWPVNGRTAGSDNRYVLDPPPPGQPDAYRPNVSDPTAGKNYFDRETGTLYLTIQGPGTYEIKTQKTFIISFQFPPMTADEFYGEHVVSNFAAFFNIPPSKVRCVSITYEQNQSGKRRKKRSTTNVVSGLIIEVADNATQYSNGTNGDALTSSELDNIQANVIDAIQLPDGNISNALNVSDQTSYSVVEVQPEPTDSNWPPSSDSQNPYTLIEQADSMVFRATIVPLHEGVPFSTQPKIQVLNNQGNAITKLGSSSSPWEITASLRSSSGTNPSAKLEGNLTTTFVNGWANFTGLLITHFGSDYIVDFNITNPTEGENFTIASAPLTIAIRPVKANVVSQTSNVISDSYMSVILELQDEVTSEVLADITSHTWSVTADLGMPELYNGTIAGTTSVSFDTVSGQASFYSLKFTERGGYVVRFHITSSPADYDFYHEVSVSVTAQSHIGMDRSETTDITWRFDNDYDSIVGTTYNNYFAAMMSSAVAMTYQDVVVENVVITRGSIVVTFVVSGSLVNVNTTVYAMCSSIQNGQSFTFNGQSLTLSSYMLVGGNAFYGVSCATDGVATADDDASLPIAGIVIGVLAALLIVAVVMIFIVWKFKIVPKTKTADLANTKYHGKTQDIDEILWREKTFMSIREQTNPCAPASTIYDKKHLY